MENTETIIFLSEMPITNGVVQAQLLPIVLAASKSGYRTQIIETLGRFDSQDEHRKNVEKKLADNGIEIKKITVPRHTMLPSILYFTLKSCPLIRKIWKKNGKSNLLIYARNYKFCPVIIINKLFRKIPFIYSPRGAYVAERKYYKKSKDLLYGFFIGFLEKTAIRKSAATVLETESFKKHLENMYKTTSDNFRVISNYYDESLIPDLSKSRQQMREQLGYGDKKVIVYAGTIEIWYDFEKMFDLVSRLKKKDPRIFFQLFAKEDYARDESLGMFGKLREIANKYNLKENQDYSISSYPPSERYSYLSASDAGICLTTPHEFKTIMLYLKVVDYLGARLPIIVNSDVVTAADIINKSGTGVIVNYNNWDEAVSKIDIDKLFRSLVNESEYKKYSSQNILPKYLELFDSVFSKTG